jgi:hypothetical protein
MGVQITPNAIPIMGGLFSSSAATASDESTLPLDDVNVHRYVPRLRPCVICIEGVPGAGKHRVAQELLNLIREFYPADKIVMVDDGVNVWRQSGLTGMALSSAILISRRETFYNVMVLYRTCGHASEASVRF